MARYSRLDLSVDEAAQLLHVQPETVRRRLRVKELRPGTGGGVRLSPGDDWLRVEDAAALLSVAPATVRSNIKRGRLVGRREDKGRWRVQLSSVLDDRRCDGDARARFAGDEGELQADELDSSTTRPRRTGRPSRDVFVRLYDDEPELLERAVDRHGTQRQAVLEGLRALDVDAPSSADVAELRAEHELQAEQLERVRTAHRNLRSHAQHPYAEVYCHHCERMVPGSELGEHELEDGTVEVFHRKHGHRGDTKLRKSTVLVRRAPLELADVD